MVKNVNTGGNPLYDVLIRTGIISGFAQTLSKEEVEKASPQWQKAFWEYMDKFEGPIERIIVAGLAIDYFSKSVNFIWDEQGESSDLIASIGDYFPFFG